MKKIVIVFALFCSLFACYGQEIYSKIDARTLLGIMRNEGYSASLNKEYISWEKDGVKSVIFFPKGNNVEQTYFCFVGCYKFDQDNDKIAKALVLCNEYNKSTFGTSYVLGDKVVFNLPLNLRNGVTKSRIIDYLDDCQTIFKTWKKEVVDKI